MTRAASRQRSFTAYDLLWNLADSDCSFCGNCGFEEVDDSWAVCSCVIDNANEKQMRQITVIRAVLERPGVEVKG